jgi:hypothetical protein
LTKHHTVYEGEEVGLILGLELIRKEGQVEGMVSMGSDNTTAVHTTHAIKLRPSHYIWEIFYKRIKIVQNKHKGMDLLVKWVPGHMDIVGNERADEEAKKVAMVGSSPLCKLPAPPRRALPQSKIKLAAIEVRSSSLRFDRMTLVDPDLSHIKFAKLMLSIRNQASILFQLCLGHIPLNTYLHRIKKVDSSICPSCHWYRETVMHYIMSCQAHTKA